MSLARVGHVTFTVARPTNRVREASRSRGRNTSSRRPSRGSQVTPINSFLKGLFGGGSADADVSIDPNPKVAVDVKQSVTVTLQRPMGLVLEPLTDKKKGAVITELVDDGNADRSGLLQVGDILVSCSFQNSPECLLGEESWYENIVDELAGETSCSTITLVIQRTIFEDNEDMLTRTADAKRYWEEKRTADCPPVITHTSYGKTDRFRGHNRSAAKRQAPKVLRRTPGVEPGNVRVEIGRGALGSGNFGTVFRGVFDGNKDKGEQRVILKNAKPEVLAAEELLEAEMDLNYFVHANARGTCARFMGCLELGPKDGGELYNGTLTEGLWLMFLNEGENTVEKLMLDGTVALASAMRCDDKSELGVARFAMKSLLASLVKLHEVGVVHRDIKPANIIVAEQDGGALKLIDLGAAALCLPDPQNPKGGQLLNYYPGVGPADPRYCSDDELFLLPEGAPRPNVDNALKLWKAHLPDRFDCVSAGITLAQLAVTGLRPANKLDAFVTELETMNWDVQKWRAENREKSGHDFTALDANDGAGWSLLSQLTHPDRKKRISAEQAMGHAFFSS